MFCIWNTWVDFLGYSGRYCYRVVWAGLTCSLPTIRPTGLLTPHLYSPFSSSFPISINKPHWIIPVLCHWNYIINWWVYMLVYQNTLISRGILGVLLLGSVTDVFFIWNPVPNLLNLYPSCHHFPSPTLPCDPICPSSTYISQLFQEVLPLRSCHCNHYGSVASLHMHFINGTNWFAGVVWLRVYATGMLHGVSSSTLLPHLPSFTLVLLPFHSQRSLPL